jgi:hypothetical protein
MGIDEHCSVGQCRRAGSLLFVPSIMSISCPVMIRPQPRQRRFSSSELHGRQRSSCRSKINFSSMETDKRSARVMRDIMPNGRARKQWAETRSLCREKDDSFSPCHGGEPTQSFMCHSEPPKAFGGEESRARSLKTASRDLSRLRQTLRRGRHCVRDDSERAQTNPLPRGEETWFSRFPRSAFLRNSSWLPDLSLILSGSLLPLFAIQLGTGPGNLQNRRIGSCDGSRANPVVWHY